ncbi:ATP-dependent helicase HrpB [Agaribacter flavus]|uniref:ATP-dependent helicase HrpB n=1 Tax=Agaribacter flavus TaxID=1902781 RepID=A0ABV7FPJ8_9ALTE
MKTALPIEAILADLSASIRESDVILVAPPGAGKSSCLPLYLLKSSQFQSKKIVMLQPRRIAARHIAHYLSAQLREPVGQTVGYRIRGESKVSASTRLEIVTEGVLVRMLQAQADLDGVGLVIFDEFHERSIHADFSLALCIEVQQALRDDLRLLVMSATLDQGNVKTLLPKAKELSSKGRQFPIDVVYCDDKYFSGKARTSFLERMSSVIIGALSKHCGDVLVFLPGISEINKLYGLLTEQIQDDTAVVLHKLYSDLSANAQQLALTRDTMGRRKIVLATNIAETSLTIEGINVVVDSGIEKVAIYHLNRGITHLQSQATSQASATQRTGRAGRLQAGTCYRMWSQDKQARLRKHSEPEIKHTDISGLMLEAAVWGTDLESLCLLDYPSKAQVEESRLRLEKLGIFDSCTKLTPLGKQVHEINGQVNLAIMLLKARTIGQAHLSLACAIAALVENKDPLSRDRGADIYLRLSYCLSQKHSKGASLIWHHIKQWHKKMSCSLCDWPLDDLGVLVAFAFPQWIARQHSEHRYLLANGSGAEIDFTDSLLSNRWLAVASMQSSDKKRDNARILYAASLSEQQIKTHFEHLVSQTEICNWSESKQRIEVQLHKKLGEITFATQALQKPTEEKLIDVWRKLMLSKGLESLPMSNRAWQLIYRIQLARTVDAKLALPDFSVASLIASIDTWLLPFLGTITRWSELHKIDFYQLLKNQITWQQEQTLMTICPEELLLPSSRLHQLDYRADGSVFLSVRMGELYGLDTHPSVAYNTKPITIELLSPAQRPIQVTQDLNGFWKGSYQSVQKDMKSQYPKHYWPDNPALAKATMTTKKKMGIV